MNVHERCFCLATSDNYETLCMSYCDNDYKCKGYDYAKPGHPFYPHCGFYTISSCPANCSKQFKGNVGSLVNRPAPVVSGCYIKFGTFIKVEPIDMLLCKLNLFSSFYLLFLLFALLRLI